MSNILNGIGKAIGFGGNMLQGAGDMQMAGNGLVGAMNPYGDNKFLQQKGAGVQHGMQPPQAQNQTVQPNPQQVAPPQGTHIMPNGAPMSNNVPMGQPPSAIQGAVAPQGQPDQYGAARGFLNAMPADKYLQSTGQGQLGMKPMPQDAGLDGNPGIDGAGGLYGAGAQGAVSQQNENPVVSQLKQIVSVPENQFAQEDPEGYQELKQVESQFMISPSPAPNPNTPVGADDGSVFECPLTRAKCGRASFMKRLELLARAGSGQISPEQALLGAQHQNLRDPISLKDSMAELGGDTSNHMAQNPLGVPGGSAAQGAIAPPKKSIMGQ